MAGTEKPYRVYRGGRARGSVPLQRRPEGAQDGRGAGRPKVRRPRRPPSWKRRIGLLLLVLLLLVVAWGVASWLSVRSGVAAANDRLPQDTQASLDEQDGLILSHPTNVLLLGVDHSPHLTREGARHADSILLLRADPSRHRLTYLSIPRDLKVDIPGSFSQKINAAMQIGGPALAVRTVKRFTNVPVNHVVIVDFSSFRELIDRLGGVDIDVPEPILSNPFDCPFTQERCRTWQGWRFGKGHQHMDGRHALVYSRIRENRLNPAENDITRAERQQQVLQATLAEMTGISTLVKLPWVGDDLVKPLATDLTTAEFAQLGWVRKRSGGNVLRCRLGGDGASFGGQDVIVPNEDNQAVIQQVLGNSAPQPPRPGSGPFGPGCLIGRQQSSS
jgi:polyisoprenyl-teichoic acid--peptidoglycan teichoic acid transferase